MMALARAAQALLFATVLMLSAGLKATLVATGQDDNMIVIRRGAQTEVQSGIDRGQAGVVESLGCRRARLQAAEEGDDVAPIARLVQVKRGEDIDLRAGRKYGAEVEACGLCVRDVGLAVLVDQNSPAGSDSLWPPQAKHPAHHVEHVDAHVAQDAVAILFE